MHVFIFSCLEVYSWKWNNDPKGWKLIVFQHRGNDYFLPSYGGGGQNSEPLTEKRTHRQKILLPQRRRSRDNWNQEPDHFVFQGQKQILQKECSVHVIDITVAFIIRACNQSFTHSIIKDKQEMMISNHCEIWVKDKNILSFCLFKNRWTMPLFF